jgi:hypothetical protein
MFTVVKHILSKSHLTAWPPKPYIPKTNTHANPNGL